MQRMLGVILASVMCLAGTAATQTTGDLTVTGVDFDSPKWGSQQIAVHMSNNTQDLKFTTIITNVVRYVLSPVYLV